MDVKESRTEFPDKINLEIVVEEKNTGEASLERLFKRIIYVTKHRSQGNKFLGKGQN